MLGLVLRLFHLGIEFSINELLSGGRRVLWAGGSDIVLNFGAGLALGWGTREIFVIAGMIGTSPRPPRRAGHARGRPLRRHRPAADRGLARGRHELRPPARRGHRPGGPSLASIRRRRARDRHLRRRLGAGARRAPVRRGARASPRWV
jgi:hypothetical protein